MAWLLLNHCKSLMLFPVSAVDADMTLASHRVRWSGFSRCLLGSIVLFVTKGGDSPTPIGNFFANYDREIAMNTKAPAIGFIIATLLAAASPAISQDAPPLSEQAKQTKALVDKAAGLIDKDGKAAFTEFRKKDSEWFHGATYLFAYDLKGNVLLNPAFPMREGTNVSGQKDAKGKLFHNEIIKTAETRGSGWVDYMFPKPGQTEPSQKWAYVSKVTIDGVPGLVASGFYPQ
jgi:cytochrome c